MRRTRVDRRLDDRLATARQDGRCVIARSNRGRKELARRKAVGLLVSPYPNLFDTPEHWMALDANERHLRVLRTLAQAQPTWCFCGLSAAVVHGIAELPNAPADEELPWVATPLTSHTGSSVRARRICMAHVEATEVDGLTVTTLARTAFDCARLLGFRRGLAVCDAALRRRGLSSAWLEEQFARYKGVRGKRAAIACARLANARSENGGESMARAAMIELGFEVPALQVEVPDLVDTWRRYRLDYFWTPGCTEKKRAELLARLARGEARAGCLEGCVAGELDGLAKTFDDRLAGEAGAQGRLLAERRRELRLTMLGLRVVRFSFAEAMDDGYLERLLTGYGVPRAGRRSASTT